MDFLTLLTTYLFPLMAIIITGLQTFFAYKQVKHAEGINKDTQNLLTTINEKISDIKNNSEETKKDIEIHITKMIDQNNTNLGMLLKHLIDKDKFKFNDGNLEIETSDNFSETAKSDHSQKTDFSEIAQMIDLMNKVSPDLTKELFMQSFKKQGKE
jgi:hypothetical protein